MTTAVGEEALQGAVVRALQRARRNRALQDQGIVQDPRNTETLDLREELGLEIQALTGNRGSNAAEKGAAGNLPNEAQLGFKLSALGNGLAAAERTFPKRPASAPCARQGSNTTPQTQAAASQVGGTFRRQRRTRQSGEDEAERHLKLFHDVVASCGLCVEVDAANPGKTVLKAVEHTKATPTRSQQLKLAERLQKKHKGARAWASPGPFQAGGRLGPAAAAAARDGKLRSSKPENASSEYFALRVGSGGPGEWQMLSDSEVQSDAAPFPQFLHESQSAKQVKMGAFTPVLAEAVCGRVPVHLTRWLPEEKGGSSDDALDSPPSAGLVAPEVLQEVLAAALAGRVPIRSITALAVHGGETQAAEQNAAVGGATNVPGPVAQESSPTAAESLHAEAKSALNVQQGADKDEANATAKNAPRSHDFWTRRGLVAGGVPVQPPPWRGVRLSDFGADDWAGLQAPPPPPQLST